jgi:hypothetical protein
MREYGRAAALCCESSRFHDFIVGGVTSVYVHKAKHDVLHVLDILLLGLVCRSDRHRSQAYHWNTIR